MAFGDIIRQAATGRALPYGVGGDANTIWHCDAMPDQVYELSTVDFSVVRQAASPGVAAWGPHDIGGDANTIWHVDVITDEIYELDAAAGAAAGGGSGGLAAGAARLLI